MQIADHTREMYRREAEQKQSDLIDKHIKMMSKGDRILFRIALDTSSTYDSEYDGRNETYCRYCDANLSDGDHDEDCDIFEAREALGTQWTTYVNAKELINTQANDKLSAKIKQEQHRREKIPCPTCEKKVSREGLKEHQKSPACAKRVEKSTLRAHEERTGIKCIVDIWINYDGPRCTYCNKPMPDAHPNKKFCTNKGKGNCKDSHNNRLPHRIQHSRDFVESQREEQNQQCLVVHPWFARGDREGWDEHKDCH